MGPPHTGTAATAAAAGLMAPALQILHWARTFEDHKSREVDDLKFCKWPIGRHGEAMLTLLREPDGLAAYGAFAALVAVCGGLPKPFRVRGLLVSERGPLSVNSLALRAFIPPDAMASAIGRLSAPEIGWLVPADESDMAAAVAEFEAARRGGAPPDSPPAAGGAQIPRRSSADSAPTGRPDNAADTRGRARVPPPDQTGPHHHPHHHTTPAAAGGGGGENEQGGAEQQPAADDGAAAERRAEQRVRAMAEAMQRISGLSAGLARELAGLPGMSPELAEQTWKAVVSDRSVRNRGAVFASRIRESLQQQ